MSFISAVLLPAVVLGFQQIDIDLFQLQDAITKDLGGDSDFYKWLGVKRNAKNKEIISAYRKVSRKLHPDRNPEAGANERFARLNQAYKYLRSEARERYDYYLSKGFPSFDADTDQWSYKRYRPSLIFSVILVALIAWFLEYIVMVVTANRKRAYFENLVKSARSEAAEASKTGVVTARTQVKLHGDKTFSVYPTGEVYYEGAKVDPEIIPIPTWKDTFIFRKIYGSKPVTESGDVLESESDISKEETVNIDSDDVETPEVKKGASRRRKAAARGKAKIF